MLGFIFMTWNDLENSTDNLHDKVSQRNKTTCLVLLDSWKLAHPQTKGKWNHSNDRTLTNRFQVEIKENA